MAFSLRFHDPASEAANFLELLLESSGDSDRGAGIFSFASVHGVSLLLADAAFEAFLRRSQFELVVGVDAVTVPAVLHRLRDAQAPIWRAPRTGILSPTGRHTLPSKSVLVRPAVQPDASSLDLET